MRHCRETYGGLAAWIWQSGLMTEPPDQTGPQDHKAEATLSVVVGLSASVSVRDYMAGQHLWNARREAWLCQQREDALLSEGNVDRRHRSHAITAVLSSIAFLEAVVNEVWQDAADSKPGEHTPRTDGIPDDAMATMRELWNGKENAERMMSLLSKFQVPLVCAGHERMETGAEPYQSADVLVDLRNALVHFKPQWWHDDASGEAKFVARLRGKITQARENRQPIGQPWYPNKVLGAGCADWACSSAITFAKDWHTRMGLTHDFDTLYLMPSEPFEVA
jgi:hypothetical protein